MNSPGAPTAAIRQYSVAEYRADCVLHIVGVLLGLTGAVVLLSGSNQLGPAPAIIYAVTLLLSLGISAAYNMWPATPIKMQLRRWDHSAIYLLIAGTYTPFFAQCQLWTLMAAVWASALVGVVLKLIRPDNMVALSIVFYLALGWSGVLAYPILAERLAPEVLWLIVAGGLVYSAGVIFHVFERIPFNTAIWHGFVVLAATIHFIAVYNVS